MMHTRVARLPLWAATLGLAVAYLATARLGLALALPPDFKATAVWPPSGIALAALLLFGPRAWFGVWAGAFIANLWDAFDPNRRGSFAAHLIASAAIATGSTLQALAGAALIRRFVGPEGVLARARDAFRFVTVVPVACLLGATVGVGALGATGLVPWAAAPTVWWTWWVGDTVGALVLAPVVLCAVRCERLRLPPLEAAALFVLLIGCCAVVFGGFGPSPARDAPLGYLSLPFLVWAAVRFGPRGATLAVVLIAAFAVWGTVHGTGPFVHTDVYQSLLLLDVFLAVVVVTSLVLGAVLREREAAEAALRASETKFRQLAEALPQIVWASGSDGATDYLNRRWVEYTGLTTATAADLARVVHPDDLNLLLATGDAVRRSGGGSQIEFRLRPARGGPYRWFLARSVPVVGPDGAPAGRLGTSTDIDDLKQAQAALAQQKAELQLILDTVPALIFFKDRDHRLVRVNNELVRLLGLPYEAIVGRTDSELGSPHADDYRAREGEIMRTGVPQTVVEPLHTFAGARWLQTTKLPYRGAAGQVTGILGFSVDITEQKAAEEEVRRLNAELEQRVAARTADLRASEERYALVVRGSQDGIWDWDVRTGAVYYSPRWKQMLGYAEHEVAARVGEWERLIHPDDRPAALAALAAYFDRTADSFGLELRMLHKDGTYRWVYTRGVARFGPDGRPDRMGGSHTDVTARRAAEAELRASEQRFRAIFDQTFQFIGLMSTDGVLLEANRTALAAVGQTEADVIGKPFWETVWWAHDPVQQARLRAAVRRAAAGEMMRFEATHPAPGGTLVRVDFSLKPFRDHTGAVSLLIPEGRDITAIKRAAEELAESEERFRTAFDHAPIGLALVSPEGRWLKVNQSLCRMLGYPADELLATDFQRITHPDDLGADLALVGRVLRGELTTYQMEKRYLHKDGRLIFALLGVSLVRGARGEPLYFVSQLKDITERKRTEQALRESEERFRAYADHSADALFVHAADGRVLDVNRQACESLGYDRGELIGCLPTDFDPCFDAARLAELNARLAAGETVAFDSRHQRKDGTTFPVEIRIRPFDTAAGLMKLAAVRDITARERAEAALRASEEQYRETIEAAPDAIVTTDARGQIVSWNRGAERVFGHTAGEAIGRDIELIVPPGFVHACRAAMAAFDPDRPRKRGALLAVTARGKGGAPTPIEIALAHWGAGPDRRFTAIIRDVTERTRAEAALRASEERYRAVVRVLAEGVVVQDRAGAVVECNDRAPEILGLTPDQLAGRTSLDPRWRAVREDGSPFPGAEHPAMVVLRTGRAVFNTLMGIRTPDDELRWITINAVPLPEPDTAGAVVVSFHDVTAVRGASDRLRASVREKEAMLKEIHHRVKNNLQIISTLLDLQSDGLNDPAALAAFRESRGRVRSMSLIHERLYRSENLASVEFGAYLRGLADDLFRAYRADDEAIRLEVAVAAPPLPLDIAIPLGLLVNELISNCLKYAFAGRERGIISVSLDHPATGALVLTVADDGVGLPAGLDLRRPTSFGLQLANTLAEQLGGELAAGGGPGARFSVRFPARG